VSRSPGESCPNRATCSVNVVRHNCPQGEGPTCAYGLTIHPVGARENIEGTGDRRALRIYRAFNTRLSRRALNGRHTKQRKHNKAHRCSTRLEKTPANGNGGTIEFTHRIWRFGFYLGTKSHERSFFGSHDWFWFTLRILTWTFMDTMGKGTDSNMEFRTHDWRMTISRIGMSIRLKVLGGVPVTVCNSTIFEFHSRLVGQPRNAS